VGSELILMPGAMVAVQRDGGAVLLIKRGDDGRSPREGRQLRQHRDRRVGRGDRGRDRRWRSDPLRLAIGVSAAYDQLPERRPHPLLCALLLVKEWRGEPYADGEEATAVRFAGLRKLPPPMHGPSELAVRLLEAFINSGLFSAALRAPGPAGTPACFAP
jgi:hypothetical protein